MFLIKHISEQNHYCEYDYLETIENVLNECPLNSAERVKLRKVPLELDPRILLDAKKGLGAVFKFLDPVPQLVC